jgi:polyhydroxyalkanoate synthesis repressor PhaR
MRGATGRRFWWLSPEDWRASPSQSPLHCVSARARIDSDVVSGVVRVRCASNPVEDLSMSSAQRLIKKYPNRRLYDTQTSTYITLADVKQLVLEQADFQVIDAKTGDDLTRQILLQIILEEEQGGMPMFTPPVLSQIIRSYGNAMQGMMGSYLEKNVQAFIDIQKKLQEQSQAFYSSNKIGPEMWTQYVNMQAPMIQSMMSNYIEQSKNLFVQMQENMQNQARSMFTSFPFQPGNEKK